MAAAMAVLAQEPDRPVMVGGLDSHLELPLLQSLDAEDRVLAEGIMDGFVPGEAAAFLVMVSEAGKTAQRAAAPVRVAAPGLADEQGHRESDQPYKGDGLAEAVRLALANGRIGAVKTVLAGLNGENIGAKEWGVASLRNHAQLDPDLRFEHPADCIGDTGAAVAPLLVGLAALGLESNTYPNPCLVWSASEGPRRAAACVSRT